MAVTRYLARNLAMDVNTGTVAVPVWTPIGGLNNITHADSSSDADTSGFDSAGRDEHMVASRGDTFTLAGFALEDTDTGARDAGQEAVETLAKEVGPDSIGQFRVTSPGGNTKTFSASAKVTLPGGGTNDPAAWGATVKVTGPIADA